jgi:hypothetical protein
MSLLHAPQEWHDLEKHSPEKIGVGRHLFCTHDEGIDFVPPVEVDLISRVVEGGIETAQLGGCQQCQMKALNSWRVHWFLARSKREFAVVCLADGHQTALGTEPASDTHTYMHIHAHTCTYMHRTVHTQHTHTYTHILNIHAHT